MPIGLQTTTFQFGNCVNIGVHRNSFLLPSERDEQLCALKSQQRFFFLQAPYTFVMVGGEKSIGKKLLLDGFLNYFGSHNLHAQVVLLGKVGPPFTSRHVSYRGRTDRPT